MDIKTETKSKQANKQTRTTTKTKQVISSGYTKICMWTKCILLPLQQQKCRYRKRDEFRWPENFILHTRLSTAQVIMGLRWTASFLLITHSSPHHILSVWNHCINQFTFSTKCPLSSDFQYISPPWDPFLWPIQFVSWWKSWWINHFILFTLMLLPWKEEIMSGFPLPGKELHATSTLLWALADCWQLRKSDKMLLFIPFFFFDQKDWVS